MIHRAILGSIERVTGVLIEHYAGAFPTWLAPVQVVICPIADRHNEHCENVADDMRAKGIRVEVDNRREKIGHKIRDAKMQKVPYILVIGDRDIEGGTAGVNPRDGEEQRGVPLAEFTEQVLEEIRDPGALLVERLWTPWRMAYIKGDERHDSCIFCDFPSQDAGNDETNLIVARGKLSLRDPQQVPVQHRPHDGHALPAHRRMGVAHAGGARRDRRLSQQKCINALKETLGSAGLQRRREPGRSRQAPGIADHVHLHVVPRWGGDTNFMTTVGDCEGHPGSARHDVDSRLKPLL